MAKSGIWFDHSEAIGSSRLISELQWLDMPVPCSQPQTNCKMLIPPLQRGIKGDFGRITSGDSVVLKKVGAYNTPLAPLKGGIHLLLPRGGDFTVNIEIGIC